MVAFFLLALPVFLFIIVKDMIAAAEELFNATGGSSSAENAIMSGAAAAAGGFAGAAAGGAQGAGAGLKAGASEIGEHLKAGNKGAAAKAALGHALHGGAHGAFHGAKHGLNNKSLESLPGTSFSSGKKGAEDAQGAVDKRHAPRRAQQTASEAAGDAREAAALEGLSEDQQHEASAVAYKAAHTAHTDASDRGKSVGDQRQAGSSAGEKAASAYIRKQKADNLPPGRGGPQPSSQSGGPGKPSQNTNSGVVFGPDGKPANQQPGV